MRKMTEQQAKLFIAAGYFPKCNEIEAIVDLQDVFGHLPYRFIVATLVDDSLKENAAKLYNLIWSSDDVKRFVLEALEYKAREEAIEKIEFEIAEKEKLLKQLKRETEAVRSFL